MKLKLLASLLCLCAITLIASPVSKWKQTTKKDGLYTGVASVASGTAKEISADADEYPDNYAFPTNEPMYWKKVGSDIVAMTPAEQAVVNEDIKQKTTVATTGDAQMDAMLRTIAEAIKNNEKTYEGVVAIFKGQVDPKKAKEEKTK